MLDNFFRDKLTDYEAPGKQGNWQLMNHLLTARERRKKILRRILFGSFFLAGVFVGYMIFVPAGEKNKNLVVSKKGQSSVIPAATPPASPVTGSAGDNSKTANSDVNNKQGDVKEENNASNNKETASSDSKHLSNENKVQNKDAFAAQTGVNNKAKVVLKKKTNHPEPTVAKSKEPVMADAGVNLTKISDNKPQNVNTNTETKETKAGEETKNPETTLIDATKTDVTKTEAENSSAVTPSAAEVQVKKDSTVDNSLAVATSPKDSLNKKLDKDSLKAISRSINHFSFNIMAGLNLYRTQSSSMVEQRSISPLVGVELMYPLSQRFSVGLGTFYSLQGGYHLSDTATQVSYFLEKNVSQQVILIRKQHRLYVPLTLYYALSDKHAVSCGVQWSYLINTVGDYTETNTGSDGTSQSEKNNVKGYMDGIESSAFSLSIGYRFSLSKRFDINTRIIQELTDSYTPEYFHGVVASPSWALQTFVSIKF